jgi:hypothetical protein
MKNCKKNQRKFTPRAWTLVAILASAAMVAVVVGALLSSRTARAQQDAITTPAPSPGQDTTIQFANQEITIDSQTGRLRKPTVEEARALVETLTGMTNRSAKGLQVERDANGGRRVDLQGRFQSVMVGKPNADGTTETRCVHNMQEAAAFLGLDPSKIPAKGN